MKIGLQARAPWKLKGVRTLTFVVPPSGGSEWGGDEWAKGSAFARGFDLPSSRHSHRLKAELQTRVPWEPRSVRTLRFVVPPSGGIGWEVDEWTKESAFAPSFDLPSSRHPRRLKAELQTGVPRKSKDVRTLTFVVPPSGGIEWGGDEWAKGSAFARDLDFPSSRHPRRLKAELQTGVSWEPRDVRTRVAI